MSFNIAIAAHGGPTYEGQGEMVSQNHDIDFFQAEIGKVPHWPWMSNCVSWCATSDREQWHIFKWQLNPSSQRWRQIILHGSFVTALHTEGCSKPYWCNADSIWSSCFKLSSWNCCFRKTSCWQHSVFKINLFSCWWSWRMSGALLSKSVCWWNAAALVILGVVVSTRVRARVLVYFSTTFCIPIALLNFF